MAQKGDAGSSSSNSSRRNNNAVKATSSTQVQKAQPVQSPEAQLETIALWTHPLLTLRLCASELIDVGGSTLRALRKWKKTVATCVVAAALLAAFVARPPADYQGLRDIVVEEGVFMAYWIVLGILSSIGLGSGLHTFLLFLGPHIIRVTVQAGLCDSVDFNTRLVGYWPHPVYADDAFQCQTGDQDVSFWQIVQKVWWAAFLWGFGTAIGELPPYFMARAARRSGQMLAELRELEEEEHESQEQAAKLPIMERAKMIMHGAIQRFGFAAILVCASVPNPLFDLAGITCGHFLIPFWTFFGATAIGKAVIKVSLQSLFYVVVFSPRTLEWVSSVLPINADSAKNTLTASISGGCWHREELGACSQCCSSLFPGHHARTSLEYCTAGCGQQHTAGSLVSSAWNVFIGVMMAWFLVSIINGTANARLIQEAKTRRKADAHLTVKKNK